MSAEQMLVVILGLTLGILVCVCVDRKLRKWRLKKRIKEVSDEIVECEEIDCFRLFDHAGDCQG